MMRSPQTRGPMMAWAGVPDAFMVSDDEEQDSDDDNVRSILCPLLTVTVLAGFSFQVDSSAIFSSPLILALCYPYYKRTGGMRS